jgi:hypothetical protein
MPLTDSEIAMIEYCLSTRIDKLLTFYIDLYKNEEKGSAKLTESIQELCNATISPSIKNYIATSDKMPPNSKTKSIIEYELYGIFQPSLFILNKLNIFSCIRNHDRVKPITQSEFDEGKYSIREQAISRLLKIFKQKNLPTLILGSDLKDALQLKLSN